MVFSDAANEPDGDARLLVCGDGFGGWRCAVVCRWWMTRVERVLGFWKEMMGFSGSLGVPATSRQGDRGAGGRQTMGRDSWMAMGETKVMEPVLSAIIFSGGLVFNPPLLCDSQPLPPQNREPTRFESVQIIFSN
ncbi:hypothetical protein MRB53_033018 [Persea americana]|uniref:Uncharacterized protein n=1 Tax=Persea americana TaxID=3435 RepID=A0ACC2KU37_PERAE|nr:hypothetical protein MRB53_033018 [Persea americana]